MGLEQWFYHPPLPPFHRIEVDAAAGAEFFLSNSGRDELTNGVEVYRQDIESDGRLVLFRSMFVAKDFGGSPSIVHRLERGGTSSQGAKWAVVIPAELVDAGLLGPENVMDESAPGRCTACLHPIPRRSPTGSCKDSVACRARRQAAEDEEAKAAWLTFIGKTGGTSIRLTNADVRGIRWAAKRLAEST